MKIPILSGIYTDNTPDFRVSYPVNLVPVAISTGLDDGYLAPADGIVATGTGPGICRGAINWNNTCYRVMGSKLVTVDANGTVTVLADVGNDGKPVTMDYGYAALPAVHSGSKPQVIAISSNNNLFYWDDSTSTLTQVVDPTGTLGNVIDVVWIDGYFLTTDGDVVVSTDLLDSTNILPGAYEATDNDPDPIVALIKMHNEVYVLNRHTIQVLTNTGTPTAGTFTFSVVDGGKIIKGCIGTRACCEFYGDIAFVGGGRNEAPAVYLGANSATTKISTREIDTILEGFTEAQLSQVIVEARNDTGHNHLYIHLPDRTIVYDASASRDLQRPIWFTLTSSLSGFGEYRARYMVWAYDGWQVADTQTVAVGRMDKTIGSHWGQPVRWEFGTTIVYAESKGALFNSLELVSLTGRVQLGIDPVITTSYSTDGSSWSQDRPIRVGSTGQTKKRLTWFQQGHMRNWRIQRFRGDSQAHLSFARLEAELEGLAY